MEKYMQTLERKENRIITDLEIYERVTAEVDRLRIGVACTLIGIDYSIANKIIASKGKDPLRLSAFTRATIMQNVPKSEAWPPMEKVLYWLKHRLIPYGDIAKQISPGETFSENTYDGIKYYEDDAKVNPTAYFATAKAAMVLGFWDSLTEEETDIDGFSVEHKRDDAERELDILEELVEIKSLLTTAQKQPFNWIVCGLCEIGDTLKPELCFYENANVKSASEAISMFTEHMISRNYKIVDFKAFKKLKTTTDD